LSATVLELVTSAYRLAGIIGDTEQPSAEQGVTGLWRLNNLMADWAADGVNLGWYRQTNLANTAPLQEGDLRGVEYCLAGELAGYFGISLSPETLAQIDSTYAKLVKRTRPYQEANLSELPRPSGPFNWGGFW
jgi:hypothetical protein